eukprot:5184764-Alexandrium_andersonii.AAC.1
MERLLASDPWVRIAGAEYNIATFTCLRPISRRLAASNVPAEALHAAARRACISRAARDADFSLVVERTQATVAARPLVGRSTTE